MAQYEVIVSDRAKIMLGAHIKFIAQLNPATARDVKINLLSAIRSLSDMPERFPFFDSEFIPCYKYHKMFVKKWYMLVYQIKETKVYVDYIIDCRQDYNWFIR